MNPQEDFDALVREVLSPVQLPSPIPQATAIAISKAPYTHEAMVDLMIARPDYTHAQLCAHFGRPASWLASVLASDAFQDAIAPRRHLVLDPTLSASLNERFKALAIHTSNVMMAKLDGKEVSDLLVLKAGEIAVKALGLGQKNYNAEAIQQAPAAPADSVAERLLAAMDRRDNAKTIDAQTIEVKS